MNYVRVKDLLGVSATALRRYGVSPDDDLEAAISKLEGAAPHLAELLKRMLEDARTRLFYN